MFSIAICLKKEPARKGNKMAFVDKKESGFKTVIKGFLTGGTQACITYPTEFAKTQLQLQSKTNPQFNGMVDCWAKTVREHGPMGLYRGAGVRIIGAGFQQMFRWGGYTNISYYLRDENGKITKTNNAIAGMGAGICEAVFAVTPVRRGPFPRCSPDLFPVNGRPFSSEQCDRML